ncbi:hypothetical protein [Candidatus Raskinella chloraquaticus]|jgi:hypothetical protein|uniref:hypothetical protein n=1 Tax=Candidatus Raskinella chloraquaticus TaxID=1951219 RepID=UPI00366BEB65
MSKTVLGFGLAVLVAFYATIDHYAGHDAQAAGFLTMAAGFLVLQTVLLMTDRR